MNDIEVQKEEPEATPAEVVEEGEGAERAREVPANPKMKWYVVNTYSGYENRAKMSLEERIKQQNLESKFGEILIPVEVVQEMHGGKQRTSKRKFFPGYMIVNMELNDDTWHVVKSTPKITGFVGNATNPSPIRPKEVERLTQQITEGVKKVAPKVTFNVGDEVRVIDGPFANFNGGVEEVNADKAKVKVMVSIFGRSTPVELDFIQVEKAR